MLPEQWLYYVGLNFYVNNQYVWVSISQNERKNQNENFKTIVFADKMNCDENSFNDSVNFCDLFNGPIDQYLKPC